MPPSDHYFVALGDLAFYVRLPLVKYFKFRSMSSLHAANATGHKIGPNIPIEK